MLESLNRWLRKRPWSAAADLRLIEDWARQRGETLKHTRRGEGCVVETVCQGYPARFEWGPPQRHYIRRRELRVRIELGLSATQETMVMNRQLAELLEEEAFDQLTRDQQTEVDASMPEEARWLAMYEPLRVPEWPAALNRDFVVLGASPAQARSWFEGPLLTGLAAAREHWLSEATPLVVMTLRGRLYLRIEGRPLDAARLDGVRRLAEVAALQALRIAQRGGRPGVGDGVGIGGLSRPVDDGLSSTLVADPGVGGDEPSRPVEGWDDEPGSHFGRHTPTDVKV